MQTPFEKQVAAALLHRLGDRVVLDHSELAACERIELRYHHRDKGMEVYLIDETFKGISPAILGRFRKEDLGS